MCLAIPARVIDINGPTAVIDAGGNRREVNVSLLDDLEVGDYVLVHAGFAISKWAEEEAKETLKIWEEIARITGEGNERP